MIGEAMGGLVLYAERIGVYVLYAILCCFMLGYGVVWCGMVWCGMVWWFLRVWNLKLEMGMELEYCLCLNGGDGGMGMGMGNCEGNGISVLDMLVIEKGG